MEGLVVGLLFKGFLEHRERLFKVFLSDGVFEGRLEAGFFGHVVLLEAFLQFFFGQYALDDVGDLSLVDYVDFGNRAHAEGLDELHVLAVIAAHDAEREVHAGRKLAQKLGIGTAVGVFRRGEKHRNGAVFGGLDNLGLKIFCSDLNDFCHSGKYRKVWARGDAPLSNGVGTACL